MGVGDPYRYPNDHENRGIRQSGRLWFCDWWCQALGNTHKAGSYLAPHHRQMIKKDGEVGEQIESIYIYMYISDTTGLTAVKAYDIFVCGPEPPS